MATTTNELRAEVLDRIDDTLSSEKVLGAEDLLLMSKALEVIDPQNESDDNGTNDDILEIYQRLGELESTAGNKNVVVDETVVEVEKLKNFDLEIAKRQTELANRYDEIAEAVGNFGTASSAMEQAIADNAVGIGSNAEIIATLSDQLTDLNNRKIIYQRNMHTMHRDGWTVLAEVDSRDYTTSHGLFKIHAETPYLGVGHVTICATTSRRAATLEHYVTDERAGLEAVRIRYDRIRSRNYLEARAAGNEAADVRVTMVAYDETDPTRDGDLRPNDWRLVSNEEARPLDETDVDVIAELSIKVQARGTVTSGTVIAQGGFEAEGDSDFKDVTVDGELHVLEETKLHHVDAQSLHVSEELTVDGKEVFHPGNKPSNADVGLGKLENLDLVARLDGETRGYAEAVAVSQELDALKKTEAELQRAVAELAGSNTDLTGKLVNYEYGDITAPLNVWTPVAEMAETANGHLGYARFKVHFTQDPVVESHQFIFEVVVSGETANFAVQPIATDIPAIELRVRKSGDNNKLYLEALVKETANGVLKVYMLSQCAEDHITDWKLYTNASEPVAENVRIDSVWKTLSINGANDAVVNTAPINVPEIQVSGKPIGGTVQSKHHELKAGNQYALVQWPVHTDMETLGDAITLKIVPADTETSGHAIIVIDHFNLETGMPVISRVDVTDNLPIERFINTISWATYGAGDPVDGTAGLLTVTAGADVNVEVVATPMANSEGVDTLTLVEPSEAMGIVADLTEELVNGSWYTFTPDDLSSDSYALMVSGTSGPFTHTNAAVAINAGESAPLVYWPTMEALSKSTASEIRLKITDKAPLEQDQIDAGQVEPTYEMVVSVDPAKTPAIELHAIKGNNYTGEMVLPVSDFSVSGYLPEDGADATPFGLSLALTALGPIEAVVVTTSLLPEGEVSPVSAVTPEISTILTAMAEGNSDRLVPDVYTLSTEEVVEQVGGQSGEEVVVTGPVGTVGFTRKASKVTVPANETVTIGKWGDYRDIMEDQTAIMTLKVTSGTTSEFGSRMTAVYTINLNLIENRLLVEGSKYAITVDGRGKWTGINTLTALTVMDSDNMALQGLGSVYMQVTSAEAVEIDAIMEVMGTDIDPNSFTLFGEDHKALFAADVTEAHRKSIAGGVIPPTSPENTVVVPMISYRSSEELIRVIDYLDESAGEIDPENPSFSGTVTASGLTVSRNSIFSGNVWAGSVTVDGELKVDSYEVYHPGNKPNRGDVGLGWVQNLGLIPNLSSNYNGYVGKEVLNEIRDKFTDMEAADLTVEPDTFIRIRPNDWISIAAIAEYKETRHTVATGYFKIAVFHNSGASQLTDDDVKAAITNQVDVLYVKAVSAGDTHYVEVLSAGVTEDTFSKIRIASNPHTDTELQVFWSYDFEAVVKVQMVALDVGKTESLQRDVNIDETTPWRDWVLPQMDNSSYPRSDLGRVIQSITEVDVVPKTMVTSNAPVVDPDAINAAVSNAISQSTDLVTEDDVRRIVADEAPSPSADSETPMPTVVKIPPLLRSGVPTVRSHSMHRHAAAIIVASATEGVKGKYVLTGKMTPNTTSESPVSFKVVIEARGMEAVIETVELRNNNIIGSGHAIDRKLWQVKLVASDTSRDAARVTTDYAKDGLKLYTLYCVFDLSGTVTTTFETLYHDSPESWEMADDRVAGSFTNVGNITYNENSEVVNDRVGNADRAFNTVSAFDVRTGILNVEGSARAESVWADVMHVRDSLYVNGNPLSGMLGGHRYVGLRTYKGKHTALGYTGLEPGMAHFAMSLTKDTVTEYVTFVVSYSGDAATIVAGSVSSNGLTLVDKVVIAKTSSRQAVATIVPKEDGVFIDYAMTSLGTFIAAANNAWRQIPEGIRTDIEDFIGEKDNDGSLNTVAVMESAKMGSGQTIIGTVKADDFSVGDETASLKAKLADLEARLNALEGS